MRFTPFLLAVVLHSAAVSSSAAQGGEIRLDSAARAGLAPLQERIEKSDSLRLKRGEITSILVAPRLVTGGLGYRSVVGTHLPRAITGPFELQRRGRATLAGAKAGAVTGGVAGAVLGVLYAGLACLDTQGCSPPVLEGALGVGALGVVTGAVAGALIGTMVPKWRTIYRYPPRPSMFP